MINSVKHNREALDDLRDGRRPRSEGKSGHKDSETTEKSAWELEAGEGRSRSDIGEEAERGTSTMLWGQIGLSAMLSSHTPVWPRVDAFISKPVSSSGR